MNCLTLLRIGPRGTLDLIPPSEPIHIENLVFGGDFIVTLKPIELELAFSILRVLPLFKY